eukprot:SAG31_NODE_4348_length_3325_cov_1.733416_6_plen_45_part_00
MNCCDYLTNQVLTVSGETNTLNYTNVACGQVCESLLWLVKHGHD